MRIKNRKLAELTPYPNNPRINDAAVEAVTNSIREFGFLVPIVVDKSGVIVAGHTRAKAAILLEMTTVPTVEAENLTESQINAYRLADNKTAEIAEWDFDKLKAELDALSDFDMTQFGNFDFPDEDETPIKTGTFKEKFSVVVDCENEEEQKTVYELLTSAGYEPKIISI